MKSNYMCTTMYYHMCTLITDTQKSSIDLNYLPPIPLILQSSHNDLRRKRRSRNSIHHPQSSNDFHEKIILGKDNWPPVSRDNWVKVMVVADGPMLKYHGDKLERYILTLMQTVN